MRTQPGAARASKSVPEVPRKACPTLEGAPLAWPARKSVSAGTNKVAQVVLEGEVDDAVGRGCRFRQGRRGRRGRLGAPWREGGEVPPRTSRSGPGHDLVAGFERLGDDGGTDVAGSAGDEDTHGMTSMSVWAWPRLSGRGSVMSATAITIHPMSAAAITRVQPELGSGVPVLAPSNHGRASVHGARP